MQTFTYRKKPVVIEAVQLTQDSDKKENPKWFEEARTKGDIILFYKFDKVNLARVLTPEGEMTARLYDYIIKGVNDELYPCKSDIFKKTYEKVSEKDDVKDLDKMLRKMPITPYNVPNVEPQRNDRFREFKEREDIKTIDAKEIKSISLNYYKQIKEYVVFAKGEGVEWGQTIYNENEAKAYYNELVEWWKYWKQN